MINEFRELVSAFIPLAPAIITILPIMWAFRSISKETADRYVAVTKECNDKWDKTNEKYYKLEEKIYKLMLERGMK